MLPSENQENTLDLRHNEHILTGNNRNIYLILHSNTYLQNITVR